MTWQPFPLPDGRYSDDVRPFAQQDVCNFLPTPAEGAGTRSPMLLKPVPGLQVFASVGDGPHRGARDVEGKLFVVSGRALYQVGTDGAATLCGTIPGTGRVSMTHNQIAGGNELVIGTIDNSYVWNTFTGTLTATGVGLQSVDFLGQMILGVDPARRFWRYSALADGTAWSSLDVESAESSPDRIVGGIVSQGEWLVFGERTIEVFSNSPNESTAFQRGAVIERGCANAATLCRLDNSVFFVDATGIPCRLQGYTPVPIAPKAIIGEIAQCDPRKLFAYTWEDRGYVVYYLTAQDGRTWGYDVTSQRWHRRESFGLDRWRLNTLFKWRGEWYGGDYASGKLYKLEWGYMYEGRDILPRKLRDGVLHNNGNRAFIHGLKITAQTGGVESVPGATPHAALTLAGNLPNGIVGDSGTMQYAATGGAPPRTFSIASGSLPPGATMDAEGLVTYAYTTPGNYSWTVRVTDAAGNTKDLADTASVAQGEWWLTRKTTGSGDSALYVGTTGLTWPTATTRTPFVEDAVYPAFADVDVALIAKINSSTTQAERITDFNYADGVTTSLVTVPQNINRIRSFGGVAVMLLANSADIHFSTDGFQTSTVYPIPQTGGGSIARDVTRLDSGRWITAGVGVPPQYFYYSDEEIPTSWTRGVRCDDTGTGAAGRLFICDGQAAVSFCGVSDFRRTTDGLAWATITLPSHGVNTNEGAASGGVMLAAMGVDGTNTRVKRSTDAGLTWTTVTIAVGYASTASRLVYAEGKWLAACNGTDPRPRIYVSPDGNAPWTQSTLPFTPNFNDELSVAHVWRTP